MAITSVNILITITFIMSSPMFKVCSLNCNGLRSVDSDKRTATFQWLKEHNFDVIFLQETHGSCVYDNDLWGREWGGKSFWSNGTKQARGVAILTSEKINVIPNTVKTDNEGRIVRLRFEWESCKYTALNVYAPNKNKSTFFGLLNDDWVDKNDNIILGGDFNCIENIQLDKNGSENFGTEGIIPLKTFTEANALTDYWRLFYPDKRQGTWSDNTGKWSRIDRFYINLKDHRVKDTSILPFTHSDHDAVSLTIENPNIVKGPGSWKLNTSHLMNEEVNDVVKDLIVSIFESTEHNFDNFLDRWDYFKIKTKQELKAVSKKLNKRKYKHKRKLLKDLEKATEIKNEGRIEYLRGQLKKLELNEANGYRIRAKAQWHEEGETSSRYFCNLEKKKGGERLFKSIEREDGTVAETTEDIMKEQTKFYSKLYRKSNIDANDINEFLEGIEKELGKDSADSIEHEFSYEEILNAIKSFSNDKSPGLDGLPAEFYKHFWNELKPYFLRMVQTVFDNGTLSRSQRQGLITLLYKKGPRESLKNWRPITLLNIDYKIITKVLAKRLGTVLPSIIHEDQTCGIKDRNIETNIHMIRDIIEYCNTENKPLALIALDQEKAFDRVEWQFMHKVIEKFNFGDNFKKWIKILYNNISSHISCNGFITDEIFPTRGLRQGCPLSALIYVMTAESLSANIRKADICGFKFPNSDLEQRIKQYADDTILLVTRNRCINTCFTIIKKYEKASGAKLNMDKTEGFWSGSWKDRTDQPAGIQWKNDYIKLVGVHLGNIPLDDINFRPKLGKISTILNIWKQRNLSLKGRSFVINVIASSGLWYYTNVLTRPKWLDKSFYSTVFEFLWSNKGRPMKDKTALLPFEKGGLDIVDINFKILTQRIMFVKRLLKSNEKWTLLPKYWFNKMILKGSNLNLGLKVFHTNLLTQNISQLPEFYQEVLSNWQLVGGCRILENNQQIKQELLVSNKEMLKHPTVKHVMRQNNFLENNNYKTVGDVLDGGPLFDKLSTKKHKKLTEIIHKVFPTTLDKQNAGKPNENEPKLGIKNSSAPQGTILPIGLLESKQLKSANYTVFNSNVPRAHAAWQLKLGEVFSNQLWESVYNNLANKLHDRQISDVSYKIIHEILPTAKRLKKIGVTNNNLCSVCSKEIESVSHLFTECPESIAFMLYVFSVLQKICPQLPLLRKTIILGIFDHMYEEKQILLGNYLLLVAKYVIWQHRNNARFHNKRINMKSKFVSIVKNKMARDLYMKTFDKSMWCLNNAIALEEISGRIKFTLN